MGCLIAVLAFISPRFVVVLMWAFTDRLSIAFDSFSTSTNAGRHSRKRSSTT